MHLTDAVFASKVQKETVIFEIFFRLNARKLAIGRHPGCYVVLSGISGNSDSFVSAPLFGWFSGHHFLMHYGLHGYQTYHWERHQDHYRRERRHTGEFLQWRGDMPFNYRSRDVRRPSRSRSPGRYTNRKNDCDGYRENLWSGSHVTAERIEWRQRRRSEDHRFYVSDFVA